MSLLEKLLGSNLDEDDEFRKSHWRSESFVQGLAQDWLDNYIYDEEPLLEATLRPDGLN